MRKATSESWRISLSASWDRFLRLGEEIYLERLRRTLRVLTDTPLRG